MTGRRLVPRLALSPEEAAESLGVSRSPLLLGHLPRPEDRPGRPAPPRRRSPELERVVRPRGDECRWGSVGCSPCRPGSASRHRPDLGSGGRDRCGCSWEATVGSGRGPRARRSFPGRWPSHARRGERTRSRARAGELKARTLVEGSATRLTGSGRACAPARSAPGRASVQAFRDPSYDQALALYACRPFSGSTRLSRLARRDVQALVDRLVAEGRPEHGAGTRSSRCACIYRRAVRDG